MERLTDQATEQELEDAALRLRNLQLEMASVAIEAGGPVEVRDEHWEDRALCTQTGPDAFFPEKGTSNDAKKVCARCRVISPCLETALARDPDKDFGVWGGTTERERRKLRKERKALEQATSA